MHASSSSATDRVPPNQRLVQFELGILLSSFYNDSLPAKYYNSYLPEDLHKKTIFDLELPNASPEKLVEIRAVIQDLMGSPQRPNSAPEAATILTQRIKEWERK